MEKEIEILGEYKIIKGFSYGKSIFLVYRKSKKIIGFFRKKEIDVWLGVGPDGKATGWTYHNNSISEARNMIKLLKELN